MNDEILQIYKETFDRIVLGIAALSVFAGVAVFFTSGAASPWFALCGSVLLMAIIAYIIRLAGRLVAASYVLVLELIGVVVAVIFRSEITSTIAPYFFIPIVIIAGLLLSPFATLLVAAGVVALAFVLLYLTGQLSLMSIALAMPALGVMLLVALLAAHNKRNLLLLGNRLVENRTLLRQRALELMQSLNRLEILQAQAVQLHKELESVRSAAAQLQSTVARENNQLLALVQGTITELNQSISTLEQSIEKISEMPTLNGHAETVELAWQKLHHLKTLVINLEEMVLIERDEFELSLEQVDVAQLVGDVTGTARGLAREKKIQIRQHVAENLSPITADPARLRQVLLQLVSNAIKFTDHGVVEIRAEVDQGQLVLFVSDTGIGMSSDEVGLVFEKFGRVSERTARGRQGPGLGLAISKRLVELHGGRMWVSSVPGVGSTFYVALPLGAAQRHYTPATSSGGKTTVRMSNLAPAQPKLAAPARKVDDGVTAILPPAASRPATAPAIPARTAPVNPNITQRLTPPAVRSPRSVRAAQPIHRYQPKYIQRFGFILLGLLFVVLLIVASIAAVNYLSGNLPAALQSEAAATKLPTLAPVMITLPTPAVSPESSPTLPPPTPSPTSPPAPTATPLPPTPTAAVVSLASPSATAEPPTATTAPTATPSPTATTAPTITLSAPTPAPVFVVSANPGATLPVPPGSNSRVSRSVGGQLAFASQQANQRDIFVVDADGAESNLSRSPGDDLQPDWSPDGRQIVFSSNRTGSFNIFVMNADGSGVTQLTNSLGFDEWPVWSPDGRRIAFVSDRDGNVELYVMNADGSSPQRLTNNAGDDWPAAWSPDGRSLVFASNRDGNWNLYVVSAGGGQPVRLTAAPSDERDPVWSPDGTTIAFVANAGGNFDVYTLPLPNGVLAEVPPERWTQITATPSDERFPTWEQAR